MSIPYAEVIGDPIAHSKSPLIHKFWLEKLGIEADYRATQIGPNELSEYVAARRLDPNWLGCNVTMPHKLSISAHLDHLNPHARRIGAVNVVMRYEDELVGLNTDWQGINLALPFEAAKGKDVVLIGAGGAGRAAMEELRMAGPKFLTLLNRDEAKARELLRHFAIEGTAGPLAAGIPPADLLINASALGMSGFPKLEVDLSLLRRAAVVMDMVYTPLETKLLQQARDKGLRAIDGLSMLIWQAAMAFRLFFRAGCEEPDSEELRALLTR